ncbi:MAG: DUF2301 domain-containing membrane protein [Oscillatoriales cyanobacterium RM1_1_9]|nr:DUF2301 domain-containing membrane protein [Oscillatoriales cyanobacterium SM2_3_0]NJO46815.1 DUF2301 domain-containing membrane protein [Oscillatoriales cyanobacterium RM2_1_1]NJO71428.1 DUF2301 domain-containing membrane protein [Oscillatoriales cyanobacterium RM1_1_9]
MIQNSPSSPLEVYQGQFGEYVIDSEDRTGVLIYRVGLMIGALCFALGSGLVLWQGENPTVLHSLTWIYGVFWLALGVSLFTIHIYLSVLHRTLQLFWLAGGIASAIVAWQYPEPLALSIYHHPTTLVGVGFVFAALTGIYFKEAFCFNRMETKLLTPLVPIFLLGHIAGIWSVMNQKFLLFFWAIQFVIFAIRKGFQAIPADVGDKSVFEYLKRNTASIE